jgi:hypothetical protein
MCWTLTNIYRFLFLVSVAGCLGYDVLANKRKSSTDDRSFSCWLSTASKWHKPEPAHHNLNNQQLKPENSVADEMVLAQHIIT